MMSGPRDETGRLSSALDVLRHAFICCGKPGRAPSAKLANNALAAQALAASRDATEENVRAAMHDDVYEICAVHCPDRQRKAAENYSGGDPHDGLRPLEYFVWGIRNDKRMFIVDTGFDQPVGTKRGRTVITPV